MALTKVPHWEAQAYADYLKSRARVPFAWGVNDCALFTADGIKAITEVDIAPEIRGKYATEADAQKLMVSVTGKANIGDALGWFCERAGMVERIHPLTAQRGDPVIVDGGLGLQAALVGLNGATVLAPGEDGLRVLSIMDVKRSWSY